MPQAFHFCLAGIRKGALADDITNFMQQLLFAGAHNLVFKLIGNIKVVFDCSLAATRDKADVTQAGLYGLLHPILDEGLVDDGQHFFGHGLGGRQKPRAVAGRRKKAFSNHRGISRLLGNHSSDIDICSVEYLHKTRRPTKLETIIRRKFAPRPCCGAKTRKQAQKHRKFRLSLAALVS